MARIWDRCGRHERAIARGGPPPADSMVAAAGLWIIGRTGGDQVRSIERTTSAARGAVRSMPGRLLDDVKMHAMTGDALHGPIFGAGAAVDDAQDAQFRVAVRASRTHRISEVFDGRLSHELQSA